MVEQQLAYTVQLIEAAGNGRLIGVRSEVQNRYNEQHAAFANTVRTSGCKSWNQRPDGRITTLFPYNARAFHRQSKTARWSDFEIRKIPSAEPVRVDEAA